MALGETPLPNVPNQGDNAAPHIQPLIYGESRVTKNAPSQSGDDDSGTHFGKRTEPVSGGPVTKNVPQEGF